jgi:hypothetical protein
MNKPPGTKDEKGFGYEIPFFYSLTKRIGQKDSTVQHTRACSSKNGPETTGKRANLPAGCDRVLRGGTQLWTERFGTPQM